MTSGPRRRLCILGAFAVLSACGNEAPHAPLHNSGAVKVQIRSAGISEAQFRHASFFVTGDRNPTLLAAVRTGTNDEINFNGHYSIAYVPCGPGCGSYWFVDRHTGGVIEAPASSIEEEMTWDIAAEPGSQVIKATFGPRDGIPVGCVEQQFRLDGAAFMEFGQRRPVECPR